jgi:hypothetical protein
MELCVTLSNKGTIMESEERFNKVQKRAYEIYLHRESNSGTPEEDWQKAEAEIDLERKFGSERSEPSGPVREILWTEIKKRA